MFDDDNPLTFDDTGSPLSVPDTISFEYEFESVAASVPRWNGTYKVEKVTTAEASFLESKCLVLDVIDYVSVADITDPLFPTEFSLTIFPNPFNATATIRYELPYPSNVSVRIYNPLGQRIGTLFEGYQQAGIYTSNMNANDLPSGLYFVRLKASGKVAIQKVMLMK